MLRNHTVSPACQHGMDRERCPLCRPDAAPTYATLSANLNVLLYDARPRLLRLARLNGIAADLAEDVVQKTCLEAWRHLEQLREPAHFASWLDGICRNICRRQASALARNAREMPLGSLEDEADLGGLISLIHWISIWRSTGTPGSADLARSGPLASLSGGTRTH